MLSPEYLECVADDIIKLYSRLECDIIRDMARRISKMNFVSSATEWQAEKLQQCGMCKEEIIKKIAKYSEMNEKEIKKLFEDAGVRSLEYDDAAYKRHGLNPLPMKQSPQMVQMIAATAKKTGRQLRNLTMTTAEFGENELIGTLDDAYMQVVSGAISHQEAVWRAVKTLTEKGGASVLYPSGHIDKIDVAVRRAVLTGVNQTVGMLTQMRMEEMQHDLVETSAHAGARPTHADWQGQRFSYSGKDKRYPDFVSSTGYGSGDGLMGWNCRHNFFPVWEDDPYTYTNADLEKMNARNIEYEGEQYTLYEIVQMQRKAERGIRQSKRTIAGYDEVLKADSTNTACRAAFEKESVRLKRREQKLKDMIRQTGISRSAERERVVGFDRSVSAKAVYAAKKEIEKYTKLLYNSNGTLYVTDDWKLKKHPHINRKYKPFAVVEVIEIKGDYIQINRTIYDEKGYMHKQIHSGHHGNYREHPYGKNGEHIHIYTWDENGNSLSRQTGDLSKRDRKENSDIL